MRHYLLAAMLGLALLPSAWAAGPYDGIWVIQFAGFTDYYSVHENNGQLGIVRLPGERNSWEALAGTRNGNRATVETILSSFDAEVELVFTSTTEATVTLTSCTPAELCTTFPVGFSLPAVRVF